MLPHPKTYIWEPGGLGDLGPFSDILARGHMALCAVSGQFVVPLEPPPPVRSLGPTPGLNLWRSDQVGRVVIYFTFLFLYLYFLLFSLVLKNSCYPVTSS